jgi:hypothetical protein
MAEHTVSLEVVLILSAKADEAQIRQFFAGYRTQADNRIASLVALAPPATAAVLLDTAWAMDVTGASPDWEVEFDLTVTVRVADGYTKPQTCGYFASFFDDAKTYVRGVVDDAPNRHKAEIVGWHIHRDGTGGDEAP